MHAVRIRPISLTLVLLASTALGGDDPIPWPGGEPPSATALQANVDDARALFELERAEAFLEASEKGEDREEITIFQEDIDAGLWDKDDLFRVGDAVFGHVFRTEDGFGATASAPLRRVHVGAYGGPDTFACADCHGVGGPDGAGAVTQNAYFLGDGDVPSDALVRNATHVLGLGFVQALAAEMSAELAAQRDEALALAIEGGASVTVDLVAKGVAFGSLTADPDGRLDTNAVQGIDS